MTTFRMCLAPIALHLCFLSWLESGCAATPPDLREEAPSEVRRVALLGDQAFPEGIAADSDSGVLFVGSLAQGAIQRVTEQGASVFKAAHADGLLNVIGLAVDAPRHRLWVCSTSFHDPTGPSALMVFDSTSGEMLASLPIPADGAPHFLNDVDVDSNGNAYATDSLAPVIWTVRADLSSIEVFARDSVFTVDPAGFNLNGVAVTPGDRYLIAAVPSLKDDGQGKLFRIELKTRAVTEIMQDLSFAGADGLTVLGERAMIASGATPGLYRLDFDAIYANAHVTPFARFEAQFAQPTTAAIAGERLWVVNSQLDHYVVEVFGDKGPPTLPFEIVGIPVSEL